MDGANYLKLWDQMDELAKNWESIWQEMSDWCLPQKDSITEIRTEGLEKSPQRMIDTCVEANFAFASGLYSYMFPSGTVWAKFKHPDPSIMEAEGVGEYFEKTSRVIHQAIIESNFAQEIQESLLDLGCFGTNNVHAEADEDSIVRFRSFTVADFRIMTNNKGMVDSVGRNIKLTSRQMYQQFGKEDLVKADRQDIIDELESGTPSADKKHGVIHLVIPRTDYDKTKMDSGNKPFASLYIDKKTKKVIRERGYSQLPYFVGRFTVGNNEAYGRSPMSMVLATARRTNAIYRSMIVSAENQANPQWLLPDDDSVTFKSNPNRAGAMIYWRATNEMARPSRLDSNGNPNIAFEMFQHHDSTIKRAFFNHLFRPLDDHRNMTAFEANQRVATDLMALAPFVNRYQDEVINPMLTYVYYLAEKQGLLPDMPEALAASPKFEIEYVGKLSLATRNFEVMGAFQTVQMFAEMAQMFPQAAAALENVDPDKLLRQAWYANSASMNALKSEKEVAETREIAQKQAAAQQSMQQLPMMADALGKSGKKPEDGSLASTILKENGAGE